MSYIGSTPTTQSFIAGTDYFNGTGSATAFTLSRSVVSVNDIQATVNNVVQVPNDAYTVSGTTITFTSAPSAGTNNIYVRYLSTTTQSITPSQNTVSYSTLNSDNQSKLGISFKNRIINGAMTISQYNGTSSVTPTSTGYVIDRFNYFFGDAGSGMRFSCQQVTTAPTGFSNSLKITTSTSGTSNAGDRYFIQQSIEGFNFSDFGWGTVNAKTVTLSFWVYSSLTGTFGGALGNESQDRSYPFTYTINAANTWEQKSITVVGDQSGTWTGATNGTGVKLYLNIATGSTRTGTAGAWAATYYTNATGSVNLGQTASATLYWTGLQLEVGTQATTFDYRSYGTELALCQRYYETSGYGVLGIGNSSTGIVFGYSYQVPKRATPTIGLVTTTQTWAQIGTADRSSSSVSIGDSSRTTVNGTSTRIEGFSSVGTNSPLICYTSNAITYSAEL